MADALEQEFEDLFSTVITNAGFKFALKDEQKKAIKNLYFRRDVLAILPTGFGKSLIFQILVLLQSEALKRRFATTRCATILVISPLRSLIEDQLEEVRDLGISATSLPEASLEEIKEGRWQLVYSSPECALEENFLEVLKVGAFHDNMAAVVIDESHTIETWTGRRKASGNDKIFRKAFGELAKLRSFCKEGTPFLALTGTADEDTVGCVEKYLMMKSPIRIFVSPERKNIVLTVNKVDKQDDMFGKLTWLIDMIKESAENCPKTLIFCNTLNDIAAIFNHLLLKLGSSAYSPPDRRTDCLIGMFHSNSFSDQKKRILQQLKGQGKTRVVIASSALSMGVNFPDIRYVVNWGPARNLLDQLQESGRKGRDGNQSHSIIYYHGKQLAHCKDDVKKFIKFDGCLRVSAYSAFDASVRPLTPKHECCSFCRRVCLCNNDQNCGVSFKFDSCTPQTPVNYLVRPVTSEDKIILKSALQELEQNMAHTVRV